MSTLRKPLAPLFPYNSKKRSQVQRRRTVNPTVEKAPGKIAHTRRKIHTTQEDKEVLDLLRSSAGDELPHEFLLKVSQGHPVMVIATGEKKAHYAVPTLEQRIKAANMAAPYFAPRLSAVQVLQGMNNEQLDQLTKEYATLSGFTITARREGTEGEGRNTASKNEASFSYLANDEEVTGT